ncbi:hypothetical protein HDV05_006848 [Chytridiales sp. JEL 0842]|nr:hypothetical protein HDV05_006848 [Chytridiales sp. JEL 0842]
MINRYMVIREIGRGVHGKVKLCVDTETGEQYAIKIVDKHARKRFGGNRFALSQRMATERQASFSSDPLTEASAPPPPPNPQLEKIKKEIAILKKCNHPNVVYLKEVIDDPQAAKIYLVLEYLAGGDVKWRDTTGILPKPVLSQDEARKVFRDTVCGLQYLHHQGIVHRDIKPANLLWTADHRVKISDFGVSVVVGDDGGNSSEEIDPVERRRRDDLELAKTAGSPAFFAPEVCAVVGDDDEDAPTGVVGGEAGHPVESDADRLVAQISSTSPRRPSISARIALLLRGTSSASNTLVTSDDDVLYDPVMDRDVPPGRASASSPVPVSVPKGLVNHNQRSSGGVALGPGKRQFSLFAGLGNGRPEIPDINSGVPPVPSVPAMYLNGKGSSQNILGGEPSSGSSPSVSPRKASAGSVASVSSVISLKQNSDGTSQSPRRPSAVSASSLNQDQQTTPSLSSRALSVPGLGGLRRMPVQSWANTHNDTDAAHSPARASSPSYLDPSPRKKQAATPSPSPRKLSKGTKQSSIMASLGLISRPGTPTISTPTDTTTPAPIELGAAIDVWALGVTLYCLIFGRVPFVAATEFELFHVISKQPLHFPSDVPICDELKDLLTRLLCKDPCKRLKLFDAKLHPWTTADLSPSEKLQWIRETDPEFGKRIVVTDEEVEGAVRVVLFDKLREGIKKLGSLVGFTRRTKSLPSTKAVDGDGKEQESHVKQEAEIGRSMVQQAHFQSDILAARSMSPPPPLHPTIKRSNSPPVEAERAPAMKRSISPPLFTAHAGIISRTSSSPSRSASPRTQHQQLVGILKPTLPSRSISPSYSPQTEIYPPSQIQLTVGPTGLPFYPASYSFPPVQQPTPPKEEQEPAWTRMDIHTFLSAHPPPPSSEDEPEIKPTFESGIVVRTEKEAEERREKWQEKILMQKGRGVFRLESGSSCYESDEHDEVDGDGDSVVNAERDVIDAWASQIEDGN